MRQTAITICRGLSHPTMSLSRIVYRGQEGPKGNKKIAAESERNETGQFGGVQVVISVRGISSSPEGAG
jgi:hypothetical protein